MNSLTKVIVLFTVATVLCAATFLLVPRLRSRDAGDADGIDVELADDDAEAESERETGDSETTGPGSSGSRAVWTVPADDPSADREKAELAVAEMRQEVEEMVRRFRGTPEERQEVIDECEAARELIRMIADLNESSIEKMPPEDLEKERENFENDYRAQLDFLQSGQLQSMLKTPEEQEVIGDTIDVMQDFLERTDAALQSAGY